MNKREIMFQIFIFLIVIIIAFSLLWEIVMSFKELDKCKYTNETIHTKLGDIDCYQYNIGNYTFYNTVD